MAQLQGTDGLGFDFSSLISSAGSLVKTLAPEAIKASVTKRIAKANAKTASYAQQAAAPRPAAQQQTPQAQQAQAAAQQRPGYDFNQLIKPAAVVGGLGIAAVVINNLTKKKGD